ncbi:MAG: DUF4111 domain-containing protein [Clostridia bacterium]|nr:DUF4111 domain-containing protein [Clostridia bacterium]
MIKQTLDLSGVTPLNRTQIEHMVHIAGQYASRIIFEHRSRTINGKSMLGILSLGMTEHEPVTLIVDGEDEEKAFEAIKTLLDNGVAPPKGPADAEQLMQVIKDRYQTLLQDKLLGIYLHGSLAAGCFQWERSDIDFLVVARRPLSAENKIALVETLYSLAPDAPPAGFEMSVILEKYCRNIPYPIPYELHYSNRYKRDYERDARGFCTRMHGEDPDLTAHILNLHAHGVAVHGPGIRRVFDQVTREDALRAIRYDVEDAEGHLHENPVYFVLNLARAVAYCQKGKVLSKKEGGEWALRHMSTDHQRVIQAALNAYETGLGMFYDEGQAEDFCFEALEEIKKAE